jgi:hypothetical protein
MRRLTLELDNKQDESLQQIAGELGETQVGVLRNGLRLIRRAVDAARAGKQLATVEPDGSVSFISGPWDDVRH